MPSVDAYQAAVASFARSLRGGVTAVMVHLTRPMGLKTLPEEALDIARAAQDVGVSIGFAVSMRDRNPLIYTQDPADQEKLLSGVDDLVASQIRDTWLRPLPAIEDQLALVDEVADALADNPAHVDLQYGPTGVQWCSDELLGAIAKASAGNGRRIHMHLLETKPQRDWADASYPQGVVQHLSDIGLLTPALTLAHCVWARDQELALIASSGARIAINLSSNLHLFSGRAPVAAMLRANCNIAMGLDGCALDEDDDALRELRLFHLLNRNPGFDQTGMTVERALRAACQTGRECLGLPAGGVIAEGAPADLLLLDMQALDRDAITRVNPRDLLFARANQAHICEVMANGQSVYNAGRFARVDLQATEQALREAYRREIAQSGALRAVWPAIEDAIGDHYRGCC